MTERLQVDSTDMLTCSIVRTDDVGRRRRCSQQAVTTMTAHQPAHEATDGTVWPELDLSFGICSEHLEPITRSFLAGGVSLESNGS